MCGPRSNAGICLQSVVMGTCTKTSVGICFNSVTISLNAKSKLDFMDGTIKILSAIDKPDEYASWKKCNDMILSWILNSLTQDSVIFSTTVQEVWEDLQDRFLQSNAPSIFQIEREIVEEKQHSLGSTRETIKNSAMAVRRAEPIALATRRGQGTSSRSIPTNRKPLHCYYCDRDHHLRETCWKMNGNPPEHPKHASNKSQKSAIIAISFLPTMLKRIR
ncbi:hypothetical protein DKX38_013231 [Salix brachista]|uniref:Retrotransposon Copia-like N-terminal domain-containing protein n=1 Tax=Salix brachista TaxID=2182728 RepID=A0A5N5LQT4_9ROSI|nr:hypothetical protein DKX38_013231 [Salix brachista]